MLGKVKRKRGRGCPATRVDSITLAMDSYESTLRRLEGTGWEQIFQKENLPMCFLRVETNRIIQN